MGLQELNKCPQDRECCDHLAQLCAVAGADSQRQSVLRRCNHHLDPGVRWTTSGAEASPADLTL